jgi:hypothetical protein
MCGGLLLSKLSRAGLYSCWNGAKPMAWFYEIRSSDEAVLKRDCGFANPDAAKIAAREEVKKIKAARLMGDPVVGRITIGHKAENATR